MRNKKLSGASRPFLLPQGIMGKAPNCKGGIPGVEPPLGGPKGPEKDLQAPDGPSPPQLIPRGADTLEDLKRALPNGANPLSQSSSINIEQ